MKTINFNETSIVVRSENVERYRAEMYRFKPISDDEVRELATAAQKGSQKALNSLVNANLRIVWSIAKNYQGMGLDFEDLLQEGNIGLMVAAQTFDVSRGTKFSTWVLEQVRKYITIALTDKSRTIRMGAHEIKAKKHYNNVSMDAPLSNEEGEDKTLLDTFASDMRADNFSETDAMRYKVNKLMQGLKPIEKEIICGLFGFGCREYTQYELSIKFNYTEERIRQIKFEALEKMRLFA